jgi:hypothetical protein
VLIDPNNIAQSEIQANIQDNVLLGILDNAQVDIQDNAKVDIQNNDLGVTLINVVLVD